MTPRPRIGLNAHLLSGSASYRSAGIHQYIDRLLRHLPAVSDDVELVVFANRQAQLAAEGLRLRATRWPTTRPLARILWEQWALPIWARLEGLQILHGLAFVLPLVHPCRTVVTVYDLSFMRFPAWFRGANAAYLRLFTRLSSRAADRVIAISESTRHDIVHYYGVPAERIDVALPGVEPAFRPLPPEQVEAFRRARGLPDTFILHVGTLEPRKNHLKLLEAFAKISNPSARPFGLSVRLRLRLRLSPKAAHAEALGAKPSVVKAGFKFRHSPRVREILNLKSEILNPKLVCVGGKGWFYDKIYAAVERLSLQDRVRFAGYAPADELPLWYNAATLFVYPSLYEGFGMPVLEALACGTPVITSNVSSLPEAAGEAALLVAPDDVDGLAAAMRQLLTTPDLRWQLSQAGLARAATFTWERTAHQTIATFRRILMHDERPLRATNNE